MQASRAPLSVAIIIPVFNESELVVDALQRLSSLRRPGLDIIVVDGGSDDDTAALATPLADAVLLSPPGRASQMNTGAAASSSDWLFFLHIDTRFPDNILTIIDSLSSASHWGFFRVRLSGSRPVFKIIAAMMNWRSQLTSVATGDQLIFVRRELFMRQRGYADIPLMEDVELCKRLRRIAKPLCIAARVTTSSRRWQQRGVLRTIALMWWMRLAYWLGVAPQRLARWYR